MRLVTDVDESAGPVVDMFILPCVIQLGIPEFAFSVSSFLPVFATLVICAIQEGSVSTGRLVRGKSVVIQGQTHICVIIPRRREAKAHRGRLPEYRYLCAIEGLGCAREHPGISSASAEYPLARYIWRSVMLVKKKNLALPTCHRTGSIMI